MKRFVCVPEEMAKICVPKEAEELSKDTQLPIKISDKHDSICIDSFPESQNIEWLKQVKSNYIFWLDATDEFNSFNEDVSLKVVFGNQVQTHKPIIKEKHVIRFRIRFIEKQKYTFYIINDGMALHEGSFEVV
jgi:hypothetical protein